YNIINQSPSKFDNTIIKSTIPQPPPPPPSLPTTTTTLLNKQSNLISTTSNQSIPKSLLIIPSQTQFNHRIQLCLDAISGMKLSMMQNLSTTIHARLHCLLLIPCGEQNHAHFTSNQLLLYYTHVIKSINSSPPVYNSSYAMELNCKLDVQLPTSWLIACQQSNYQSNLINNQNNNQNNNDNVVNNYEITLFEAILNGDECHMEQYARPITKPCLMIQVDLWLQNNMSKRFNDLNHANIKYW
ncbi:unnamed protein product, partial [Schistosoma turkestanicum]